LRERQGPLSKAPARLPCPAFRGAFGLAFSPLGKRPKLVLVEVRDLAAPEARDHEAADVAIHHLVHQRGDVAVLVAIDLAGGAAPVPAAGRDLAEPGDAHVVGSRLARLDEVGRTVEAGTSLRGGHGSTSPSRDRCRPGS